MSKCYITELDDGKIYRRPLYDPIYIYINMMVKTMVSCRSSIQLPSSCQLFEAITALLLNIANFAQAENRSKSVPIRSDGPIFGVI